MTDHLAVYTDAGIRTIALANPPRNLLHPALMLDVVEAFDDLDADPDVTGIIVTGSGDAFCGGLDVEAIRSGGDPVEFATRLVELLDRIPRMTKPVVAALNGDAVASGASIACACDYVVAVPSAAIGTYEVSVGIWPMVAQVPLIHRIGPRLAMENVGSGQPWAAERAAQVGAVNEIVEPAELMAACTHWLSLARRGCDAVKAGRPIFYELAELPYHEALTTALGHFVAMFDKS